MTAELVVLLEGRPVATLRQESGGALALAYDEEAYADPRAIPISLSMPVSAGVHRGTVVRAYCQGLLPDNETVLERWGREFHVSAGKAFALLCHVGEDCAGAVQFVRPERLRPMLERVGSVTPL